MTWAELREHCLSLPGAAETFPFEPTVSVFKAPNGKMFGVTTEKAEPIDISVKCEPAIGEALRAQYGSIAPGYMSAAPLPRLNRPSRSKPSPPVTRPDARRRKGFKLVVKRASRRPGVIREKGTAIGLTLRFVRRR